MPIVIGNKTYSEKLTKSSWNEVYDAIKKLPSPQIITREEAGLNSENTVICLQREAILNLPTELDSKTRFLASKNVGDCIFIYMHTTTDHLAVHCDITTGFNFEENIKKFRSKNNIQITFAGGTNSSFSNSKEILYNVVQELFRIALANNWNIIFDKQILGENYPLSEEDIPEFLYEATLDVANLISQQKFNKPFLFPADQERFTYLKRIKDYSTSIDAKSIINLFVDFTKVVYEYHEKEQFDKYFSRLMGKNADQVKYFNYLVLELFSREGYVLLMDNLKGILPDSKLTNFAFDCETGNIIPISQNMPTEQEELRMVVISDWQKNNVKYITYMDGTKAHLPIPKLSKEFLEVCNKYVETGSNSIASSRYVMSQDFQARTGAVIQDHEFKWICKFLRVFHAKKESLNTLTSSFFNKPISSTWKNYPAEKLTGNYIGHQVLFFTMRPDISEQASNFQGYLKHKGIDAELKKAKDNPSIVVDVTTSKFTL